MRRHRFWRPMVSAVGAAVLMLVACAHAPAVPTDADLAPLKEQLDRKIQVQFLETPLDRVIETLQREAKVTVLIERAQLSTDDLKSPISLQAPNMSIRDALDLATRAAGVDWDVDKGVLIISSQSAIVRRHVTTEVYDIRSLLTYTPDFIGPTLAIDSALSNTNSGGSNADLGANVARASTGLFSTAYHSEIEGQASREEKVEQITSLIQDSVGHQDEWAAYGGDISSLRDLNGDLIVKTTARNHEQIRALLDQLRTNAGRMISIEARYLAIKTTLLDQLLAANQGMLVLDAKQADQFLAQALQGNAGSKRLALTRTVCHNGQRVFLTAGNEMTFLSDVEPIPGTSGVDPTLSTVRNGAVLDVQPTLGRDGASILITLRSEIVTGSDLRDSVLPTGGRDNGISIETTGKLNGRVTPQPQPQTDVKKNAPAPGKIGATVDTTGRLIASQPPTFGNARLEMPSQDIVRYRSSIEMPAGGAVVLTGVSSLIKSEQGQDTEVVMILRARTKANKP